MNLFVVYFLSFLFSSFLLLFIFFLCSSCFSSFSIFDYVKFVKYSLFFSFSFCFHSVIFSVGFWIFLLLGLSFLFLLPLILNLTYSGPLFSQVESLFSFLLYFYFLSAFFWFCFFSVVLCVELPVVVQRLMEFQP